jgi:hypothetical protein
MTTKTTRTETVTVDIGVDAGMLMLVDPCYVLRQDWKDKPGAYTANPTYDQLLKQMEESGAWEGQCNDVHRFAGGVVFGTRHGDGTYRARITIDKASKRPVRLTIDLE